MMADMSNVVYQRGQVEWALWRTFRPIGSRDQGPTQIFKTRIKRLLDLDREIDGTDSEGPEARLPAFVASYGSGNGADYAARDVFALAIALDLLNIGFKQGEIVFVMRWMREILDDWYPDLVARPSLIDRQQRLASAFPNLPSYEAKNGRALLADARVFLLLNRIEITEVMSRSARKGNSAKAEFLQPEVAEGLSTLLDRLNALMPLHRRSVIVIEITAIAQSVSTFLEEAPDIRRGRPRNT